MQVKELRTKSAEELQKLLGDLKAELFLLRFQNSTGQLSQPHKIRDVKKNIAKIFTILHEQGTKNVSVANAKVSEDAIARAAEAPAPKAEVKEAPKAEESKEEVKEDNGEDK